MTDKFVHGGNIYRFTKKEREYLKDFSANINPFGPSKFGLDACENWQNMIGHYPEPENRSLIKDIAIFYNVDEDQIALGNGATELLYLLTNVLRPTKTFIPNPTFSEYERAATGICSEIIYFNQENKYQVWDSIGEGDFVYICTPNNPDGKIFTIKDFRTLATMVQERCAKLIIDESFIDFNPDLISYRKYLDINKNLLIIHSFTKFWAVPGLRIGALFASEELVEKINQRKDIWNVNVLAAAYLKAALQDKEFFIKSQKFISAEKDRVYSLYKTISLTEVCYPQANFILLRLPEKISAEEFCKRVLEKGYLIRNCDNYIGLDKHYIRIAIRDKENNDNLFKIIKGEVEEFT